MAYSSIAPAQKQHRNDHSYVKMAGRIERGAQTVKPSQDKHLSRFLTTPGPFGACGRHGYHRFDVFNADETVSPPGVQSCASFGKRTR